MDLISKDLILSEGDEENDEEMDGMGEIEDPDEFKEEDFPNEESENL